MGNTWQAILISFILIVFAMFYATANFTQVDWKDIYLSDKIYYICEAIFLVLTSVAFYFSNRTLIFKKVWAILAGFFLIRLITIFSWAIFKANTIYTGRITETMFCLTFGIITYITFYPLLITWLKHR